MVYKKTKVLVVDDELDVRALLIEELNSLGYLTMELTSAVGLVEIVLDEQPDIILLDITMPVMNGLDALRLLKSNSQTSMIPVVMASAQSRQDVLLEARDLGAADFLVKPWQDGEVEWRVETILKDRSDRAA